MPLTWKSNYWIKEKDKKPKGWAIWRIYPDGSEYIVRAHSSFEDAVREIVQSFYGSDTCYISLAPNGKKWFYKGAISPAELPPEIRQRLEFTPTKVYIFQSPGTKIYVSKDGELVGVD